MKAKERIRRYGIKAYIKTCTHKEATEESISKYKDKYGILMPEDRPVRYQQTYWSMVLKKKGVKHRVSCESKAHKESNNERDIGEAFREAEGKLGSSGWELVKAEYKGKRFLYHEEEEIWGKGEETRGEQQKLPTEEPKELLSQQEKEGWVKAMISGGMSPKDIGIAIKEMY